MWLYLNIYLVYYKIDIRDGFLLFKLKKKKKKLVYGFRKLEKKKHYRNTENVVQFGYDLKLCCMVHVHVCDCLIYLSISLAFAFLCNFKLNCLRLIFIIIGYYMINKRLKFYLGFGEQFRT